MFAMFFGDWRNFEGYSDIGYYLGTEVVRYAGKVLEDVYKRQLFLTVCGDRQS